jgi:RNA-directed DNA polymerase
MNGLSTVSLLGELAAALEMPEGDIDSIVQSAPRRYKLFTIKKRNGTDRRVIAQPARALKAMQRYVIAAKLNALPIHPIASAYRAGRSIADNASAHAGKRVILKLDFRDFFNSITPGALAAVLNDADLDTVTSADRIMLIAILFWFNPLDNRLCLAIGAPSSPFISNAVMEPLDRQFDAIARAHSARCTRYADDITLSANSIENLLQAEQELRQAVARAPQPRLRFNVAKRGIFTSAGRRLVTGLVLTPDGKVSLGRERKRTISAALHHITVGRNATHAHREETRGWLAYANSVEPAFVMTMAVKYPRAFRAVMGMGFATREVLAEAPLE